MFRAVLCIERRSKVSDLGIQKRGAKELKYPQFPKYLGLIPPSLIGRSNYDLCTGLGLDSKSCRLS
jgi:hypothetical protein